MRNIDILSQKVYDMPAFQSKGRKTVLEDIFLVSVETKPYVVCIMHHANLDGTNVHYSYVIYSASEEILLESGNPVNDVILESLPTLEGASKLGGRINPFVQNSLIKEFDTLLGSFLQNGKLTEGEKKQYLSYLGQSQEMQSPSFAAIYQASKELI